jgi:hypothetical protein
VSRVFLRGRIDHDPLPVTVGDGQKIHCGVCHLAHFDDDWTARCARCSVALTRAYIASKPARDFKIGALIGAAQVSFEDALAEVDRALLDHNDSAALRHLDTAITYGNILRSVAAASKARRKEPLTVDAIVELHMQALRVLSRCAPWFDRDGFELALLRRFAAMYATATHDDLPSTRPELVAFCAYRVAWAESECAGVNLLAANYCTGFDWTSIRQALAHEGYDFDAARAAGNGPFADGERGRIEAAAVLGIDATAAPTEIKKAYYREAAKHHPDRLGEAPDHLRLAAEERMKEINAAYELLTA